MGSRHGRKRIARLMRGAGLTGDKCLASSGFLALKSRLPSLFNFNQPKLFK